MDDDQFAAFVAGRGTALLRTACYLTASRADGEDLLQHSLTSAYASFRRLRTPEALEAYVRTTMARAAISGWRRPWHRHETSRADVPADDRDQLLRLLRELPARQRTVVVLRYYEDLSEAQIAERLGCTPGSVKQHAHRALDHLRRAMDEQIAAAREEVETRD